MSGGVGLLVQASAGGNTVPVLAKLLQTSDDRVREMIHRLDELGMVALDPHWAGGRPLRRTTEAFIVETAKTRPQKLGMPCTRWSIRELVAFLAKKKDRPISIGRERLRQFLAKHGVTFHRTKT